MILMSGPNTKPYAIVHEDGRIELDPDNPNARDLLYERYPNLLAAFDRQVESDAIINEVVSTMRGRGELVGAEADVFARLENIQRRRMVRNAA